MKYLRVVGIAFFLAVSASLSVNHGRSQTREPPEANQVVIGGKSLPRPMKGEVPIGTVMPFAGPQDSGQEAAVKQWLELQGWMLCDGRPLRQQDAPMLFDVLGTSHGAGFDSIATPHVENAQFNIPDYRGRFLRGVTRETDRDPDARDRTEMNTEGNEGNLIGSLQGDATALPSGEGNDFKTESAGEHHHSGTTQVAGAHIHEIPHDNGRTGTAFALARIRDRKSSANASHETTKDGQHDHDFTTEDAGDHHHLVTGGGNRETRPINANVNWIIKFKYGPP
ncbi:MAG: phage tail protein [Pirellulales bacterium]